MGERAPESKPDEERLEDLPVFDSEESAKREEIKETPPELVEAEISDLKRNIGESYKLNAEAPEKREDSAEESSQAEPSVGPLKKMGIYAGRLLSPLVGFFESKAGKFDIERHGAEHLEELKGRPYILAANHIKPKNILLRAAGLSPDSFVIRRVVKEESQRTPNIVANVSGKIRKIPILGLIDKIWSPFREGLMEGAGFTPIKMRRGESGGFNRNFIKKFRESINRGEPTIIFPQGQWDKDFNSEREFESGAATLAKNYDLPVIPVYIHGGRSWSSEEQVSVSFGQIIIPKGKTKGEIINEVRENITRMQDERIENE